MPIVANIFLYHRQENNYLKILLKRVNSVNNKARHQCDEDKNSGKDGRTVRTCSVGIAQCAICTSEYPYASTPRNT